MTVSSIENPYVYTFGKDVVYYQPTLKYGGSRVSLLAEFDDPFFSGSIYDQMQKTHILSILPSLGVLTFITHPKGKTGYGFIYPDFYKITSSIPEEAYQLRCKLRIASKLELFYTGSNKKETLSVLDNEVQSLILKERADA
jgi:hypothetical protein